MSTLRLNNIINKDAEAKRQQVRDKYADIQNQIDAAADVQALKAIVEAL